MYRHWYNKSAKQLADEQQISLVSGLLQEQVQERIEKHGYNELKEKEKETLIQKIINQLKDFLIIILIVASIVSAFVGEVADALVIIAIVIVNAILGVVQEGKAEKALEALKKMSAPNAKVLRNGKVEVIPARTIVPGDVVLIEAGDIIPADMRLFDTANLKIDEASLTGESVPVEKDGNALLEGEIGLGDRVNMAYMGTIVTYGRGKGLIFKTANETEIGKIANKIQEIEDEQTPLQKKLAQLGKWLGLICIGVCILVFLEGLIRGGSIFEMFMIAVSLAVAAIPEGLPAVVTIVLALGMKRMVARNAIIRKLLAVETLGCVDVICSDKTGTLTQNEMTVKKIYLYGDTVDISGQGYDPTGEFINSEGNKVDLAAYEDLRTLLSMGVLCNDATLEKKADGQWGIVGDPTEGAMIVVGQKAGHLKNETNSKYPRIAEIPFDSDRKMMTTFHQSFSSGVVSFTKGAPDIILKKCKKILKDGNTLDLTVDISDQISKANSSFASSALRVLAFAYREYESLPDVISSEAIESDMIFVGLMGMIDPARAEAKDAIAVCRKAGIKPVMITGDYKDTAVAIAKDLKLMEEGDGVLTGQELDIMSDEEMLDEVEKTSVYARVSPEHKVRIVDALRKNGHIASMTGDGVNDAMALKRADIGVAMGITGTDVAKGTADIVLTDDNFASIVSAVEEGRIIFSNIRKFVFFLLSCNIAEILIIFFSILVNLPVPLIPIQLLWLNLVSDSFPALALGAEKGEPDIMDMKPRSAKEPILNRKLFTGIILLSIAQTVSVLVAFVWALKTHNNDLEYSRTIAFTTLVAVELIMAFSCRSERIPLVKLGILSNRSLVSAVSFSFLLMLIILYIPFLQPIFKTVPLGLKDWGVVLGLSLIPLIVGEIGKLFSKKH